MQTVLKIMEEFSITPENFFDFEYLTGDEELETQIINIIRKQPIDRKRIMYKIIKQFDI